MVKINYYDLYREMKNPSSMRLNMVLYALEHSISRTAREFGSTRVTVMKWIKRYQEKGRSGLCDVSRRPSHSPSRITKDMEEKILAIRHRYPNKGPYRIKDEHHLPCSEPTIYRVIKQAGLIRARKKKPQVKHNLRAVKALMRAFEKIQIDLKELCDIPHFYPYYWQNYPKYQITARDVRTGLMFLGYAYEKTTTNVAVFTYSLGCHLRQCGVDLSQTVWQSDNGTEFIGPWNQKRGRTLYEQIVQEMNSPRRMNSESIQIPVGRKTYLSAERRITATSKPLIA